MISRYKYQVLTAVVVVYLFLAVGSVRTFLPWSDEAWFSEPAYQLLTNGHTGLTVLDETALWSTNNLLRINQRSYWTPPLHMVAQTAWYQITGGFSLFNLRYHSTFWGMLAILAWYAIMRRISGDERVALATSALLAVDFTFIWTAAEGRMDMMAVSLSQLSFAAFLLLRERNFPLAVLLSQACVCAAGMTHPMALGSFFALLALTLYYDGRRIRLTHVLIAAVPYLIGAAGWAWHISKDVEAFRAQFGGNVSGRFALQDGIGPFLYRQLVRRYLHMFGLAPETQGFGHVKLFVLAVYAVSLAGLLFTRGLRSRPGYFALIVMWASSAVINLMVDKEVRTFYLIHFLMFIVPMTAVWLVWCWDRKLLPRWMLGGAVAVFVLIQLATIGSRWRQDLYTNAYVATTDYLKQHALGKGLIIGSAELGFALGFDNRVVVDDYRLGFRSGKQPAYVVIDRNRYEEWIEKLRKQEPATYAYLKDLLEKRFHKVLDVREYKVYARNE